MDWPAPTRAHGNDRLRVPPVPPPQQSPRGKKESSGPHPNQASPPSVTQSSSRSRSRLQPAARIAAEPSILRICQNSASYATKPHLHRRNHLLLDQSISPDLSECSAWHGSSCFVLLFMLVGLGQFLSRRVRALLLRPLASLKLGCELINQPIGCFP